MIFDLKNDRLEEEDVRGFFSNGVISASSRERLFLDSLKELKPARSVISSVSYSE